MNRKEYWNDTYVKYWKEATAEANDTSSSESHVKKLYKGDSKTAGEKVIFNTLDLLRIQNQEKLLDYGCGFGRLVPYFASRSADYYGIDISEAMIEECRKQYPDLAERFFVAEGENLPFPDAFFDKIVCYAVFDACYQETALQEMFRVLKVEGEILLSGKNTNYFADDGQAYIAEEAARVKGHPNYFTDVKAMIDAICSEGGGEIVLQRFFLYRGDEAKEKYVESMPEKFYQWYLIIKKRKPVRGFPKFSDAYSETWKLKQTQLEENDAR